MASLAIDSILLILRNQIQFGWILSSLFVKIKTVCECVRARVCVCGGRGGGRQPYVPLPSGTW